MRKADHILDTPGRRCHGFSLVELMVALVITLILLAGIGQVYLSSKKSFTIQDTLGHQQENARYAVEVIAQDARRASYWGGNADIGLITGTAGIVDDDGTCSSADNSWGRMLDRPVFGKNNTNAGYACIPNSDYLGSDILVIRYQAPWQVPSQTTPSFDTNRLYLRSSLTASGEALGRVFKGKDQDNLSNDMDLDASTPPEPSERVAELVSHAYYIGPSPATCNGQAVPALFRESLDENGLPAAEEIATGVEKFEAEYGVDNDGDKSVDEYVDADNVTDWGEVIAIRYWLLTRAECPETGYTNDTDYDADYNIPDIVSPFNDGYRRQVYNTTVMLRNR